ncbi:MAG: D-alanine--D-alanine ligase A, partial [Anaerovoracaceae bacterium]
KYISGGSKTTIVKDLKEEKLESIQKTAIEIYKALNCSGMARVDFFLKDNGELIFNEINTIPGFTKISMYPQLWMDMGLTFTELIDKLIELGIENWEEKNGEN